MAADDRRRLAVRVGLLTGRRMQMCRRAALQRRRLTSPNRRVYGSARLVCARRRCRRRRPYDGPTRLTGAGTLIWQPRCAITELQHRPPVRPSLTTPGRRPLVNWKPVVKAVDVISRRMPHQRHKRYAANDLSKSCQRCLCGLPRTSHTHCLLPVDRVRPAGAWWSWSHVEDEAARLALGVALRR